MHSKLKIMALALSLTALLAGCNKNIEKTEEPSAEDNNVATAIQEEYAQLKGFNTTISATNSVDNITYQAEVSCDLEQHHVEASLTKPFLLKDLHLEYDDGEMDITYRDKTFTMEELPIRISPSYFEQFPQLLSQVLTQQTPEVNGSYAVYQLDESEQFSSIPELAEVECTLYMDTGTLKPAKLVVEDGQKVTVEFDEFEKY